MSSTFSTLSRLITVRDLSAPLYGPIEVSVPAKDAWQDWSEESIDRDTNPMDEIALATDGGSVVGWLAYESLEEGKTVGECVDVIAPDAILSANTPVIDAVRSLAKTRHHFFFTLEGQSLSGWIGFSHLYKLPFRLCLFSLLLGIEQLASELISTKPTTSLKVLRPKRLEKLKEVYRLRKLGLDKDGNQSDALLVDCTTFADKIMILRRVFKGVVPACGDPVFDAAEKIRNDLAHPRRDGDLAESLKRETLLPLIEWSETIQRELEAALGQGVRQTLPVPE
jgi:hypothetical protein